MNFFSKKTTGLDANFEIFKNFTEQWNRSMSMQKKFQIAQLSDNINNKGALAYSSGNIEGAIILFNEALNIMPNNDDALKNLRICYNETGNYSKVSEVERKLKYLSQM